MARELEEETGLALNALAEPQLRPCGRVYVRYPEVDFVYHMYKARLVERHQPPSIRIDERCAAKIRQMNASSKLTTTHVREHKTHRWATLAEALELPLVRGEVACIELAYPQVKHGYECV
ncbi:uncharacterized protein ACA1_081810 [Acanthamoeba castellanii str. Neff]|uniref:Nudix hydrolase domain-containing protein n=1 Tax=Acanthamoeba castellanii (strain ATCC 30010 / Neff) TaxID=1257118 RepID=L8HBX7_ACACF|nr:uncharacterized protein ACA1_081810 [Acanthamoeba castellanii str. Neff]ELR22690.1 hypothetical protein ACA1_081810 [Acanthamoeba castellanii str. Neff]